MMNLNLFQNEAILRVVRKHWIAIIGPIVSFILIALIPPLLVFATSLYIGPVFLLTLGKGIFLLLFGYALFLLFTWVFLFIAWTSFYLDVWIVTNVRVFVVDQKALFIREISSFTLDKIQDLTIDINGPLATFMKFGKITVETAADKIIFIFDNARRPEEVKQIINDAQEGYQISK